jgi:hypothetical protein
MGSRIRPGTPCSCACRRASMCPGNTEWDPDHKTGIGTRRGKSCRRRHQFRVCTSQRYERERRSLYIGTDRMWKQIPWGTEPDLRTSSGSTTPRGTPRNELSRSHSRRLLCSWSSCTAGTWEQCRRRSGGQRYKARAALLGLGNCGLPGTTYSAALRRGSRCPTCSAPGRLRCRSCILRDRACKRSRSRTLRPGTSLGILWSSYRQSRPGNGCS